MKSLFHILVLLMLSVPTYSIAAIIETPRCVNHQWVTVQNWEIVAEPTTCNSDHDLLAPDQVYVMANSEYGNPDTYIIYARFRVYQSDQTGFVVLKSKAYKPGFKEGKWEQDKYDGGGWYCPGRNESFIDKQQCPIY